MLNEFKSNEQNLFEASCSIIWSELSQVKQAYKLKIFALIPVYLHLKNGKLFNYIKEDEKNESYLNLNEPNKILIYESKFDLNNRNLIFVSFQKAMNFPLSQASKTFEKTICFADFRVAVNFS